MKLIQPANTVKYDVKSSDTLTSIALRYNTTPTELSRLNHLASSLLYPGQTLFVPEGTGSPTSEEHEIPIQNKIPVVKEKSQTFSYIPRSPVKSLSPRHYSISPDHSLEDLLQRQDSEEEVCRRYLRIKSKYITDGQGVVSGVLLVTPQTIMFNPSVSDHLVMDRGREAYVVRLPLKALSMVTIFEEIAAMVTDDVTKQYIPTDYEQYRPFSPPRPGMIVCQDTGEEFAISNSSPQSQSSNDKKQTLLNMVEEQLGSIKIDANKESTGNNEKCERSSDNDDTHDVKMAENDSSDQGISSMMSSETISSDTMINESESNTITPTPQNETSQPPPTSQDETSPPPDGTDKKDEFDFNDSVQSSTPKHTYDNNKVAQDSTFSKTKHLHLDLNTRSSGGSEVMNSKDITNLPQTFDNSKDSGISDMTRSHSTAESNSDVSHSIVEGNSDVTDSIVDGNGDASHSNTEGGVLLDRQQSRSSLSDEARKWLGKHSVSSDSPISPDVEPRPVAEFHDPLIYISVKVSKRYWCPTLAKHNAIMGIPPNRDQKRRQHWFAIPREKIDQFYGYVIHWLPDLSGISTPTSEDNNLEIEEGLNIVDDTFGNSPASSFGWEKLNREDADSMKLRVNSIHSTSSKASLKSLDDEPETSCESQLLTKDQLKYLVRSLPSVTVGRCMELVYSTILHGISLKTLYRNFEIYDCPTLLVVRDENHKTFGAFLSDIPAISDGFYGTGECMLFSLENEKNVKTYKWSGENSFFIKGSKTSLTVGGGQGVLGLWIDEDLYYGRTHACSTFNNEVLSQNEDFICTGLEAWAFI